MALDQEIELVIDDEPAQVVDMRTRKPVQKPAAGKRTWEAIKQISIIMSLILNVLFLIAVVILLLTIGTLNRMMLTPMVDDIIGRIDGMQTARIKTTIPIDKKIDINGIPVDISSTLPIDQVLTVADTIPVDQPIQLNTTIPVNQQIEVQLTRPTTVYGVPAQIDLGSGNVLNHATVSSLTLPAGTKLPILLQTNIPVNQPIQLKTSIPVTLNVPVKFTQPVELKQVPITMKNVPVQFLGNDEVPVDIDISKTEMGDRIGKLKELLLVVKGVLNALPH